MCVCAAFFSFFLIFSFLCGYFIAVSISRRDSSRTKKLKKKSFFVSISLLWLNLSHVTNSTCHWSDFKLSTIRNLTAINCFHFLLLFNCSPLVIFYSFCRRHRALVIACHFVIASMEIFLIVSFSAFFLYFWCRAVSITMNSWSTTTKRVKSRVHESHKRRKRSSTK